jgi:hypothetical protein
LQFDVEGLQPGCEGTSALFLPMWRGNWLLIAQYCLPSLIALISAHAICRLLGSAQSLNGKATIRLGCPGKEHVRHFEKSVPSPLLHSAKQWTWDRLLVAFFTLVDLVYLNVCTITLKAFMCIGTDVAFRLVAERSQLCWSHDHVSAAMFSLLVYPLLLFYPLFVYCQGLHGLKSRLKSRSGDESRIAGSLSGNSLQDEYQPMGRAYASGFRHIVALFNTVPLDSVRVRLIIAAFPLLFVAVIVAKRPFRKWWLNACM